MRKLRFYTVFITLTLAICSLSTSCGMFEPKYANNHLALYDMERYFVKSGVKIESVQPLVRQVVRADRGISLKIAGKEIGIYKYDINKKVQLNRLSKMKKNGYIYIMAIKYPVMVNGTFMMLGYHKNPEKNKIVEVFKSFKPQE